jgi:hypothetical protein
MKDNSIKKTNFLDYIFAEDTNFNYLPEELLSIEQIYEKIVPPLISPSDDEIPDFNEKYTIKAGTYNQKFIWASGFYGKDYRAFVIFDKENKAQSFVVVKIKPVLIAGELRTLVVRSRTRDDSKRQGLATSIYLFLAKKLDLKLICDEKLSSDSILVYKNFIKKQLFNNVLFYNELTQQMQNEEPQDLWSPNNNNWRILLEDIGIKNRQRFGHSGYRRIAELIKDLSDFD